MSILKIGISSRALFDLGESHEIFKKEGIEEYSNCLLYTSDAADE